MVQRLLQQYVICFYSSGSSAHQTGNRPMESGRRKCRNASFQPGKERGTEDDLIGRNALGAGCCQRDRTETTPAIAV